MNNKQESLLNKLIDEHADCMNGHHNESGLEESSQWMTILLLESLCSRKFTVDDNGRIKEVL